MAIALTLSIILTSSLAQEDEASIIPEIETNEEGRLSEEVEPDRNNDINEENSDGDALDDTTESV